MSAKLKVLYLCTGNSCRSQMAEGWTKKLKSADIEPYSAGTEPHGMDSYAVKVMAEAGVDISRQRSKHVSEFTDMEFDYVITLCSDAHEKCPFFPGKTKVFHAGFDDPARLAADITDEEEKLVVYRRVRDEIKIFTGKLPDIVVS